jgi:hypothetical protein
MILPTASFKLLVVVVVVVVVAFLVLGALALSFEVPPFADSMPYTWLMLYVATISSHLLALGALAPAMFCLGPLKTNRIPMPADDLGQAQQAGVAALHQHGSGSESEQPPQDCRALLPMSNV